MTFDGEHYDKALQVLALIELTMKAEYLDDAPKRIETLWPDVDDLNEMFTLLLTFAAATVISVDYHCIGEIDGDGVDWHDEDDSSPYVDQMRLSIMREFGAL